MFTAVSVGAIQPAEGPMTDIEPSALHAAMRDHSKFSQSGTGANLSTNHLNGYFAFGHFPSIQSQRE
jgi:hypothetical protein